MADPAPPPRKSFRILLDGESVAPIAPEPSPDARQSGGRVQSGYTANNPHTFERDLDTLVEQRAKGLADEFPGLSIEDARKVALREGETKRLYPPEARVAGEDILGAHRLPDTRGKALSRVVGGRPIRVQVGPPEPGTGEAQFREAEEQFRTGPLLAGASALWEGVESPPMSAEEAKATGMDRPWVQKTKDIAATTWAAQLSPVDSFVHLFGGDIPGLSTMGEVAEAIGAVPENVAAYGADTGVQKIVSPTGLSRLTKATAAAVNAPELLAAAGKRLGMKEASVSALRQWGEDSQRHPAFDEAGAAFDKGESGAFDAVAWRELPTSVAGKPSVRAFRNADLSDPVYDKVRDRIARGGSDEQVLDDIGQLPLAAVRAVEPAEMPSDGTLHKRWKRRQEVLSETGDMELHELEKLVGAAMLRPATDDSGAMVFVPSPIQTAMRLAGAAPTLITEADIAPIAAWPGLAPVVEWLGKTTGQEQIAAKLIHARIPTPAGAEAMIRSGAYDDWLRAAGLRSSEDYDALRTPESRYLSRVAAQLYSPEFQGLQTHEVGERLGVDPTSPTMRTLKAINLAFDFFFPAEELVLGPVGEAAAVGNRAFHAYRIERGAAGAEKISRAIAAAGSDGLRAVNDVTAEAAEQALRQGDRVPMEPATAREVEGVLADAGLDPKGTVAEVNAERQAAQNQRMDTLAEMMSREATPEQAALRQSAPYQRRRQELVDMGWSERDIDATMRMNETRAFRLANEGKIPSPEHYFGVHRRVEGGTPATGAYTQTVSIRRGKENLIKYGLKPKNGKYKTREVAAALESRQREKYGSIDWADRSPAARNRLAKWMAEEIQFELDAPGRSGRGWYSERYPAALAEMAKLHPELATSPEQRAIFTAPVAVASDEALVEKNLDTAEAIYANLKKTGRFELPHAHGKHDAALMLNLGRLQAVYERLGAAGFTDHMLRETTVAKHNAALRKAGRAADVSTDYLATTRIPFAATIVGPKLGAFFSNLMGKGGYLTMDRWWSRTFNRYRGNLLTKATPEGIERVRQLLGRPDLTDDEVLSATVPIRNEYARRKYKDGSKLEKAANTVWKAAFDELEDAPANASDRAFMADTAKRAQSLLRRRGHDVTIADIQAILWYYEKRLYGELGARSTADIAFDEAARRVVDRRLSGRGAPDVEGVGGGSGERAPEGLGGGDALDPGADDFDEGAVVRQPEAPAYRAVAQQTETPEFKRWFGDWQADPAAASKVVDVEGEPRVMVHATDTDWAEFDDSRALSSMGLHLGTPEQANAVRLTGGTKADVTAVRPMEGQRSMPLYANIKNPLRMEDKGDWYPWRIVDELAAKGIVDDAPLPENARELAGMDRPHLDRAWQSQSDARKKLDVVGHQAAAALLREEPKATRDAVQHAMRLAERNYVRDLIERHGYDGVVYDNMYEGGGDSYIAFRPEQVKSATANIGTFDPTQLSILRSPTGAPVAPPPVEVLDFPRVVDRHPADAGPWPEQTGPIHWSMGLQEVEHLLSGEGGEHVVLFASDGRQIARAGPTETVAFAPTVDPAKGCVVHPEVIAAARADGNAVFTHNHPSGVVFSTEDLLLAARGNVAEIRAVADGEGEAWILRRPAAGWPTELRMQAAGRAVNRRAFEDANAATDARVRAAGGNPFDREHAKGYDHAAWTTDLNDGYRRNWNAYFGPLGLRLERVPVVDRQGLAATVPAARPAAGVRGRALAPSHLPGGHPVVREPGDAGAVELPHEGQPLFQRLGADVRGSIEPDSVTRRMSEANPAWAAWDARRRELEAADTSVADHAQAVVDAQRRLQSLRDNPAPADPEWHAELDEATEHLAALREAPPPPNAELAAHLTAEPAARIEVEHTLAGYVIRLFEKADFSTLVHEDLHLLRFLYGDAWVDQLVRFFDSEPDPARPGMRKLTRKGEEDFVGAAQKLVMQKLKPDGRTRQMWRDFKDGLSELWSRLRGRGGLIPPGFRRWWDVALNPADRIERRMVPVHPAPQRGPGFPIVYTAADIAAQKAESKVAGAGAAREFSRARRSPEETRAVLGISEADTTVDPVRAYARAYAHVLTTRLSRHWGFGEVTRLTSRVAVPAARVEAVTRAVRSKIDHVLAAPLSFEGGIARLSPEQRVGVRALAEEAMNHALGERIGDMLLAEDRVTEGQWNSIVDVLTDIEAGPTAFRDRRAERAATGAVLGLCRWLDDKVKDGPARELLDGLSARFNVEAFAETYLGPREKEALAQLNRELGDISGWIRRVVKETKAGTPGAELPDLYRALASHLPARFTASVVQDLRKAFGRFSGEVNLADLLEAVQDGSLRRVFAGLVAGSTERELVALSTLDWMLAHPDAPEEVIADAVSVVQAGLRRRWEAVTQDSNAILQAFAGDPTEAPMAGWGKAGKDTLDQVQARTYERFFSGDLATWQDIYRDVLAHGYSVRENRYSEAGAMVAALGRMRAQALVNGFFRRMVEEGIPDVERIARGAGDVPSEAYVDRVLHYLAGPTGWTETTIRYTDLNGKVVTQRLAPVARADVEGTVDLQAYSDAQRILNRWGFRYGQGLGWERRTLSDGSVVVLPDMIWKHINENAAKAAKIGLATIPGIDPTKTLSALGRAMELAWRPLAFTVGMARIGVTTGIIIPNPAYYVGNLFGGFLQLHQAAGPKAAARILGRAMNLASNDGRFVAALVGRLWDDGAGLYRLPVRPLVTATGTVHSIDSAVDMAVRFGLNSSFPKAESARAIVSDVVRAAGTRAERWARDPFWPLRWWQEQLMESATAIDNVFRSAVFVDGLKRGLAPEEAAAEARRAAFDYGALTDFEREKVRSIVMFYTYMRRNVDLSLWTLANHPERALGQLRAMATLQREWLGQDSEPVWPQYMDGRFIAYFEQAAKESQVADLKEGTAIVLPPVPFVDFLNLFGDAARAWQGADDAQRELLARLTPWAQAPVVLATDIDPFSGRDVDDYSMVPNWLVEADRLWTGGAIVDGVLRVEGMQQRDPSQEAYPLADRWQARNGEAWWVMRSLLQFPPFGRSMETITQAERAMETGPGTAAVRAGEAYRKSALAPAGDLVVEEAVKPVMQLAPGAYTEPVARPVPLGAEDYATVRPGLQPWMEWSALFGVKPVQVDTRAVAADRIQRKLESKVKEELSGERKGEEYRYR